MNKPKLTCMIFIASLVVVSLVLGQIAPEGPESVTPGTADHRSEYTGQTITAEAGNITSLTLIASTVTQTWQGYYGNITGVLTLDNSANATMYNWSLADPEGYIFATTKTTVPDWTEVECYDATNTSTDQYYTLAEFRTDIGLVSTDVDDIAATFTDQAHGAIYFSGVTIAANACSNVVYLFDSTEASVVGKYGEVLLFDDDGATGSIIYTTFIEDGTVNGFGGTDTDFQFIVAENAHLSNTASTTYYIYAWLE